MTRDQICTRIQELSVQGHALNNRYAGFMSLYNAACIENNQPAMEEYRQSIISIVEQILDNNAVQFLLTRQLIELGGPGFTNS